MNLFDVDTAVRRIPNPDPRTIAFEAEMSRNWWIVRGPNGGYVAAVMLRALAEAVGDPERAPRSLTLHYAAPPPEGSVRIEVRIERRGRSLSTLSARMFAGEKLLVLALAAFSAPRPGGSLRNARMPEVAPPERCVSLRDVEGGIRLPLHERYDYRWAFGGRPYTGAPEAALGGWIRLEEPRVADALAVAAFTDAFPPAVMSTLTPGSTLGAMPTVDLTIHFRSTLPLEGSSAGDHLLAVFRAREAREGFFEEDGEIWTPDGTLVAHSRQLAVLL